MHLTLLRGRKSHLHVKLMLGCDLGRSTHFQYSISSCTISVLTSRQNTAMGVILHKHFALLNIHRRLPVSSQLIKFALRSTKEYKYKSVFTDPAWSKRKGFASIWVSGGSGAKPGFQQGNASSGSRMGAALRGWSEWWHTLPEPEKRLEGRAFLLRSFLETRT